MYDILPGDSRPETSEKGIFPRFYMRAVENKAKSKEEGRPIFQDVEYVEVIIAGDKNNKPHFKVTDEHKKRWPDQYNKFKDGIEQIPDGTRLEEWPRMTGSRAKELKAVGIFTVEQLAELPDTAIQGIGIGGRELVNEAKNFIDNKDDVSDLKKQNAELLKRIEELEKKPTRKKRTKKAA
jgi:hypothetical protein